MKKQNSLITQESTEVVLKKATNIINRTNKILKNSKRELVTHPDVMMINGLMWQKETVEERMHWDDAMEYAKNLRLGGYDDWRLPTIDELEKIVIDCGGISTKNKKNWAELWDKNEANESYQECYKLKGFGSSDYWSSTSNKGYTYTAWIVNFNNGSVYYYNKYYNLYVRCVRAGE